MGSGLSACRKPRPPAQEVVVPAKSSVAAVNGFGLRMLQALQPEGSAASVFISPLSISSSLVRVALGATAQGAAKKQLMGMWGLEENDADAFARDLHNVDRTLMSMKAVKLLTANSIWCSKAIKDSYKASLATLDTEAMPLNGVGPVNAWVSKATEGMIPTLLTTLDPETVAAIVNAVYFKGSWQDQFEVAATRLSNFRMPGGGEKPCAMMARFDKAMRYAEYQGAQVAELPYQGGSVAAMVVLPKQGQDSLAELSALLKLLATSDAVSGVAASLQPTEVSLRMPRFRLEFGVRDLKKELLGRFGLADAFSSSGQFLGMADDPSVALSNVFHKAVVEVNEEGTKAAAATAAVMARGGASLTAPPPKEMLVDRPFLFLIRERDTGALLFAGTVVDPELDTSGL